MYESETRIKPVNNQVYLVRYISLHFYRFHPDSFVPSPFHIFPPTVSSEEAIITDFTTEKKREGETKKLMEQLDKLLLLSKDPEYSQFSEFFREADNFLSPLCGMREFKMTILRSLAPIYPYLQNIEL